MDLSFDDVLKQRDILQTKVAECEGVIEKKSIVIATLHEDLRRNKLNYEDETLKQRGAMQCKMSECEELITKKEQEMAALREQIAGQNANFDEFQKEFEEILRQRDDLHYKMFKLAEERNTLCAQKEDLENKLMNLEKVVAQCTDLQCKLSERDEERKKLYAHKEAGSGNEEHKASEGQRRTEAMGMLFSPVGAFAAICILPTLSYTYGGPPVLPVLAPNFGPAKPPDHCNTHCLTNMTDVAMMWWQSNETNTKNGERYNKVCEGYEETKQCVESIKDCPTYDFYTTVNSGIKYMCEEQRVAFDYLKSCMDEHLMNVYQICDSECRPVALLHGLVWKQVLQDVFPVMRNLDRKLNRVGINEGCKTSKCLLMCMKTKYNALCNGTLGSLIVKTVMRPFSDMYDSTDGATLWLKYLLPDGCSYLYDKAQMTEFMIPTADEQLIKAEYQKLTVDQNAKLVRLGVPENDDYRKDIMWRLLPKLPRKIE
ncbi:hypothetical protein QR680_019179 [Steinernema hermaphroditum]|uniref:Chondroitin proteoglycan 4 domain-containing protein n=1 Tax=Steinernema hermaphroditum TaxID=289476 RepID=A0AA39LS65_9BILA|nr:hypothetical protein QR680_019179 [Steinernema hermaphroditum]